jgi:cholest-4-en-3-one 26-monooxygenase
MTVAEVDLSDPTCFVAAVPHEWFAHLRDHDPVRWCPERAGPGFWSVTRYEDCVAVNRDWEQFSSSLGTTLHDFDPETLAQQQLMMINMDPPLHTRYRRLVNRAFTPRTVRDLRARTEVLADSVIDAVCEQGEADFVEEVAAELPLLVLAELLGIPASDRRMVFDWSNRLVGSADPEYQASDTQVAEAALQVYAYADELLAARRRAPGSDILSDLVVAEVDGERLEPLELDLFFLLLMVAGNETTRNLISGAMAAFFTHPQQWSALGRDRSLLPSAVEEMLRWVSPVLHFRRTALGDCTLRGVDIAAGDKVVFWHASANRDPAAFEAPDHLDITRSPNPHIAFGAGGPHFCLGANLARMEAAVMFERLLDRLVDLEPDGDAERLCSNFLNGIKHLRVRFTPRPATGSR